jgi:hypothetical protein
MVCPYVRSFITKLSLHEIRRPCFRCRCGGYPTQDIVALSVINHLAGAATKLNAIGKIRKYTWIHEQHHFI